MSSVEDVVFSSPQSESLKGARDFITELLVSPACPQYTMNIDQLDGYLRAVAVEPMPTTPKDWMPLVFGGEFPCFISGYSIDSITNTLICLYNSHRVQVLTNQCVLSFLPEYTADNTMRIQSEQWARGFMQGYIFWQDIWGKFLDENQTGLNQAVILPRSTNDEIDDILATVSAVADPDYAMQTGATVNDLARMFKVLPEKVIEYGRIAHIIRSSLVTTCERVNT